MTSVTLPNKRNKIELITLIYNYNMNKVDSAITLLYKSTSYVININ